MDKSIEAIQKKGVWKVYIKILQSIARHSLVPGVIRSRLQSLRGVKFKNVKSVFFGDNVVIDGIYPENVYIGERCLITSGTRILTHFLDTESLSDNKNFYFRFYQGKVVIEDDVFIGYNCVIAKPITIGKGSVIGANTVLTKDVPAGSVMVGAPAKNLKQIF